MFLDNDKRIIFGVTYQIISSRIESTDPQRSSAAESVVSSVAVSAEMSFRSPRKLFIFMIKN